jgi:hypothetical protein
MTYQLTITGESLDDLMSKVGTGNPTPAALSTDDMIEELKQRLEKEGRTLVVRAQRNTKKKADDAVEEEADEDGSDEADDDKEAPSSEIDSDEANEPDTSTKASVSESVDFETAMQAVKAAVLDTENTELAAKVRRTMGKFMADRPHITKMNEITKADDQEAFCELVEAELPELFADDEAGF